MSPMDIAVRVLVVAAVGTVLALVVVAVWLTRDWWREVQKAYEPKRDARPTSNADDFGGFPG